jgi:antitoxin HicB
MKARKVSKAAGSSFDGWLNEQDDAFKAEVIAGAMKRQFVMKLRAMMKAQGIGVTTLQKMLGTGPSQVQRLLDPEDIGISLKSIAKLLAVLGMAGQISVEPKLSKKQVA